jgi:LacI family transcriptional regulator
LRDSSEISDVTKAKVLELALKLNYSPNPIAISLLSNKTKTIGILVPKIDNPFFSTAIAGAEEYAYNRGYHVMIYQSHESFEREVLNVRHLATRRADGLLVSVSSQTARYDHFLELQSQGIPVVFFDRVPAEVNTHKVIVDDYKSSFEATEHLIHQGCRKIAHVSGPLNLAICRNRLSGYKDALMALRNRPDGIFAASDRIGLGVHVALRQLGYQIPEDVALIGFSDLSISALIEPALSTVRQPSFEMGHQAAELLFSLIETKTNTPASFETRVLTSDLIVRNSSKKSTEIFKLPSEIP